MTLTSSNYKNIKILIAEDLPSDALLNEREARKTFQDVSLKIVDSEKEFIKALTEFKPDIVLSDYNMPGFNGLEALKITEAMSPSTPVIIVTGSVNEETAVECMRAGANNYVLKEQLRRLGPALQHAMEEKQTKEAHLKARQDLIESEQRYRLLFDLSPIGVILQNENGFIINVNDHICEMLGYLQHEMIGQHISLIAFESTLDDINKNILDILSGERLQHELKTRKKEGEILITSVTETSIKMPDGTIGIMSIIEDITERKQNEELLKKKSEELTEQYKKLSLLNINLQSNLKLLNQTNEELASAKTTQEKMVNDLKIAKEKAEESDKLKSAFLANMSHEIRTPLNAIIGFSDLICEKQLHDASIQGYREIIKTSGDRLLQIINDIIDLSKLEAGSLKLNLVPTNLAHLADNAFKAHVRTENALKKKHIIEMNLIIDEDVKELQIKTDPIRVQQILDNFITNALKYTKQGNIDIHLSRQFIKGVNSIVFQVKDTGIGIPAEKQNIIFVRFRQVEEEGYHQGAGLGLSISKGLTDLLGGSIWFRSAPGIGSTFSFSIPIVDAQVENSQYNLKNNKKDISKWSIFIAEDDPDSSILLKAILSPEQSKLSFAYDGLELLRLLEKETPDLILLDLNMPGMSGYECLERIKKSGIPSKVIVQSAYAMTEERNRCMELGCDAFVVKPLTKKELFDAIEQISSGIK